MKFNGNSKDINKSEKKTITFSNAVFSNRQNNKSTRNHQKANSGLWPSGSIIVLLSKVRSRRGDPWAPA